MSHIATTERIVQAEVSRGSSITKTKIKRGVAGLALLSGAIGAVGFGHHYWSVGQYLESTDDAYVKTDIATVAPKISGYISDVYVADNEHVTKGQALARIDDRDFATARDQSDAEVDVTNANLKTLNAQIALQYSIVDQAEANVVAAAATLNLAQQDDHRYQELIRTGAASLQKAEEAQASFKKAAAESQREKAALLAAEKQIDVLTSTRAKVFAEHDRAAAVAHQAELNLSYTTIRAAIDGEVGARTLRVGQFVQAGTQLMALVPRQAAYAIANFKETQLTHVKAGQPVEIVIDSFPGKALKGHVDSLSPASGLEFSLLPPDNATGNFTKIVQRIPVKILFDDPAQARLLRSGMSVEPTIDTKSH